MGLIYLYPTEDNDPDHFLKTEKSLTLRSYGLPSIFWAYAIGILGVLFLLYIPIHGPLQKYKEIGEQIDQIFIICLYGRLIFTPLTLISFFFFEKNLIVSKGIIRIVSKLFFFKIKEKKIPYSSADEIKVGHFIDSPNMARIKDDRAMKAFYNRGYHELIFKSVNSDKEILIDRAARKADLEKIKTLMLDYL